MWSCLSSQRFPRHDLQSDDALLLFPTSEPCAPVCSGSSMEAMGIDEVEEAAATDEMRFAFPLSFAQVGRRGVLC